MTRTKNVGSDRRAIDEVEDIASHAPSQHDYIRYVQEMSAELARISDRADLPTEIGYLLRVAACAADNAATRMDCGDAAVT